MGDDTMLSEYPDAAQRLAVCSSQVKTKFQDTYADYGDGVKNNAKRGIELNERNGNKCATQTGKVRAQQLAKGSALKRSSACIATCRGRKRTTTTQIAPATADTSATCYGAARLRLAGAGTSYEN
jgi:hypothetical protein